MVVEASEGEEEGGKRTEQASMCPVQRPRSTVLRSRSLSFFPEAGRATE